MEDYEKLCRFCLKETSEFAVNIFKDENGRSLIQEVIAFLPPSWARELPRWPRFACLDCAEMLNEVIKFLHMASKSFDILTQKLPSKRTIVPRKSITNQIIAKNAAPIVINDDDNAPNSNDLDGDEGDEDNMEFLEDNDDQACADQSNEDKGDDSADESSVAVSPRKEEETFLSEGCHPESPNENEAIAESSILEDIFPENDSNYEEDEDMDELSDTIEFVTDDDEDNSSSMRENQVLTLGHSTEITAAAPDEEPPKKKRRKPYTRLPPEISRKLALQRERRKLGLTCVKTSRVRANWFIPLTEEEQKLEAIMLELKLFECRQCGEDQETHYGLKAHVQQKHPDVQNYDICCNMRLITSAKFLYDHIRFHLDKDAFKCQQCKYRGSSSTNLQYHILHYCGKIAKFVCDICGAGYVTGHKLDQHRKSHDKSLWKVCQYCQKSFSSEYYLLTHVQKQHEIVVNFLCDLCGKGFPARNSLGSHLRDHGGPHGGRRKKKSIWKPRPTTSSLPYNDAYFDQSPTLKG